MDTYAKALSIAIPVFVLLIGIESIVALYRGKKINNAMDTISSLFSGMTNTLRDIIGLTIVVVSYSWMVDKIALYHIESQLWIYILCFIGLDFAQYWSHRWNHVINVFWNRHIVHHSSEEFNLACALRQPVSDIIGIYFFLYIPLALIGIEGQVIALVAPLHLFAQFWYHTKLIDNMGFLEHIIVTPSHHRVHHAINEKYLDKNYAAIFIVWDKWFGTFQKELEDTPPVYGVKRPVKTWNPLLINFQHFWSLLKDAWRTKSWKDKLRLWFMPTGWRPKDVEQHYPIKSIENVYAFEKYNTPASTIFLTWSWTQLIILNAFFYHLLLQLGHLSWNALVLYGLYLMVSIFAITTIMDRHKFGMHAEFVRFLFGLFLLFFFQGWFGRTPGHNTLSTVLLIYFILSFAASMYFTEEAKRIKRNVSSV